jgi:hypothetical protein
MKRKHTEYKERKSGWIELPRDKATYKQDWFAGQRDHPLEALNGSLNEGVYKINGIYPQSKKL